MMRNILLVAALSIIIFSSTASAARSSFYSGFAEPHPSYSLDSRDISFQDSDDTFDLSVSTDDFAVYHYGYVSYDGKDWERFEFSGKALGGEWLNGSVSAQVAMKASNFDLSASRLSASRNFVVAYSCSRTGNAWDCHTGWQIWQFDATLLPESQDIQIVGVTDSGHVTDNLPEKTLDGNLICDDGAWSADGDGQWVTYELSEQAWISYVRFAFCYDTKRHFDVQLSNDSVQWVTALPGLWSRGANPDSLERFDLPSPVQARYVRFLGHGSNISMWNALTEADINGFDVNLSESQPSCTGHSSSACYEGDVWWYDSCGEREDMLYDCTSTQICSEGQCVDDENPGDDKVVVFAEDFENLPDMQGRTLMKYWQIYQANYVQDSNYLVEPADWDYGKVWHGIFHEGRYMGGNDDGYAFAIPLGDAYDEMWLDWDFYADPDFDPYSTTGKYSGKMMPGFGGGNDVLRDGTWHLDQSADGNGWVAHFVWGSQYAIRLYYYDQLADGQTNQISPGMTIPRGNWIHGTMRVKMNTPGQRDGIFEFYLNGQLKAQNSSVMWRSAEQGPDMNRVEFIFPAFFFGGGGTEYICPRDNYVRMDNIIAYYYKPSSGNYLSGPAPANHVVPIVRPSGEVYPERLLFNETFTDASGTIRTHYVGAYPPYSYDVIEKRIVRPSGPIRMTFTNFNAGWDVWPTMNSWTKVYSGTGAGKTLLYTFDKFNPPGGTYTIDASSATIEFFSGWSHSEGWTLQYTS